MTETKKLFRATPFALTLSLIARTKQSMDFFFGKKSLNRQACPLYVEDNVGQLQLLLVP